MENFIDHQISSKVSRQFRRVIVGNTNIQYDDNGDELRNARWKYKKHKYTANYAMLSRDAQEAMVGAFYAANAMLKLFRFRDHGDYTASDSPLTVEVGTTTPAQITKRYFFGPAYADRLIQAIDSWEIKDASGNPVDGSMDTALGLFTPTNPWASGQHTWTGRFSVWVRFASDEFDMTLQTMEIATADVELQEARAHR